ADEALPGLLPLTLDSSSSISLLSFFLDENRHNEKSHQVSVKVIRLDDRFKDCDFVHSGGESCGDWRRGRQLDLGDVAARASDDCPSAGWATWLKVPGGSFPAAAVAPPELCAWPLARWWHPGCLAEFPATDWMRKRLDGVRVVFLGDSTLRGLMFSLFHIANAFPERNAGRAGSAFNRTVIVIGGAQWLTGAELLQTREFAGQSLTPNLGSLGLQVPVIVKDLSPRISHSSTRSDLQPLTVDTARELSNRNSQLHSISASLGFSMLPTFRLSAARYREFHPGKGGQAATEAFEVDGDIHRTCLGLLTALLDSVL
uniref:SGNH_hydro domain-containing protein n=1 Tax=Macrostomum lignano TaxID=282301 RepID=A0A1I8FKJ4_9PLAT